MDISSVRCLSLTAAPVEQASLYRVVITLHVAPVREWKFADHVVAIRGVPIVEVFVRFRTDPFSGDEVVELFHFDMSVNAARETHQLCSRDKE